MSTHEIWFFAIAFVCGATSIWMYLRYDFRRECKVITTTETVREGYLTTVCSDVRIVTEEPVGNKQRRYTWFAVGMLFLITAMVSLFLSQPN